MKGIGNYGEIKRGPNTPFSLMAPPSVSKPPLLLPSSTSPFCLCMKSHSLTINDNAFGALDNKSDLPHKNITLSNPAFPKDDDSMPITDQQQQQQSQQPPNQDPRKLKRVVSNRVFAQRFRLRMHQRVARLERQSKILENQIVFLQPQIQAYINEKQLLLQEKKVLTQKLATLDKEKVAKQDEIEFHQGEVQMLRELEKLQKQELQNQAMMAYYNWNNTFLNNQFVSKPIVDPNYPFQAGGLENTEGTSSGMEVNDEQNVMNFNMNSSDPMNELQVIVNPWITQAKNDFNTESGHGV